MTGAEYRGIALLACVVLATAAVFQLAPIPQDPAYHGLADRRTLLGIPNALNVVSNLPFLLVGLYGLAAVRRLPPAVSRAAWLVFCVGVTLVSLGSVWYHLAPSNATLYWDRLPIAVAFMGLFSLVISDRVSARLGRVLLWPAVVAALGAVVWWHVSEGRGAGDLRAYVLVQGVPLLVIPLTLLVGRQGVLAVSLVWGALAAYGLAKLTEGADHPILAATGGLVSGHTLKHLLAAVAVWLAVRAFVAPATVGVTARPSPGPRTGCPDRSRRR